MGVRMASSPMVGPCLNGFIEAAYRLLFNAARGLESAVEIRVTILARPPYTRTRTRAHTHTHTHTSPTGLGHTSDPLWTSVPCP